MAEDTNLRDLVRARLASGNIQEKIKECVTQVERDGSAQREESLLKVLEEKGLIDHVIDGLKLQAQRESTVASKGETTGGKDVTVTGTHLINI